MVVLLKNEAELSPKSLLAHRRTIRRQKLQHLAPKLHGIAAAFARIEAAGEVEFLRSLVVVADFERHLGTSPRLCLLLDGCHQPFADTLSLTLWRHAEIVNVKDRLGSKRRKTDKTNCQARRHITGKGD